MATKIITKHSAVASSVPATGDLDQGELALNVTDKKIYTKDSGGSIVELGASDGYVANDSIRANVGSVSNVGLGFNGSNDIGFYVDSNCLHTSVGGGPAMWISPLAKYGFGTPSQVEASGTQAGISFSPLSNPMSKWSNSLGYYLQFFDKNSNSEIGYIVNNFGTLQFTNISDYRLKENVVPLTGAIDRVKQIPVHRFSFVDRGDTVVDGFLAHEVQEVVPEAVFGTKDGTKVDEEGNTVPEYQGIDQSKLVPLLGR
jgi:hypothetical protein